MIDKTLLVEYSKKYKIDQYTVLREYLQIIFLNQLFEERVNEKVVFKGGTALRLLYKSPRFSEDLDFNCSMEVSELKTLLAKVEAKMAKVIPRLYSKELNTIQGFSSKLYFESDLSSMPLTIKLDFSFREKTIDITKQPIPTELPVLSYSLVNSFSAKEILAEKVRTVFQRSKGRDIYDIWFLLNKNTAIDIDLINEKMKLINRKFKYDEFIAIIDSYSSKQLKNDLFKFLPVKDREIVSHLTRFVVNDFKY